MVPIIELCICRKATTWDYLSDGSLQCIRFEQKSDGPRPSNLHMVGLFTKDACKHARVLSNTLVHIHAQAPEHDGYQAGTIREHIQQHKNGLTPQY